MSLVARLLELAAQMARHQQMPAPGDWPGWGPRVPQKLWCAAHEECEKAENQCGEWAREIKDVADQLCAIERAATIAAYKHCAGHCDNKRSAASAAEAIRAEIAKLEAEK